MEEDLVSFEVAKLASEVGFDCECRYYYGNDDEVHVAAYYEYDINNKTKEDSIVDIKYAIPTQSLLKKWLREKYKIFVDCSHSRINDDEVITLYQVHITAVSCAHSYNFKWLGCSSDCYGETYKEAMDKGLIAGMNSIEKYGKPLKTDEDG